jgi:hypothetical protein
MICFINFNETINGSQFINAVGKEAAATIENVQAVTVTDIRKNRKLNISSEQLKSFKLYVIKDSSYIFDMKKRCLFVPQLTYEFKGSPDVTIYVSMICNQVKIVSDDESTILDYDLVKDDFNNLNEVLINQ